MPELSATAAQEPAIIYEDQDLIVLNKPPGIHSVRLASSREFSVAEWLAQRSPELEKVGKSSGDCGLVQRLDFETSGLLLAAKNNSIWESLHRQILSGEIDKYYYCLVEGKFTESLLEVNSFIGSPYRSAKKVRVYSKKPGKPHRALVAQTIFHLEAASEKPAQSLLRVTAPTARRHQIRVHAASIGHPLVGDSLYLSKSKLQIDYPVAFFLQAGFISFKHPGNGKKLEFKLDLPEVVLMKKLEWSEFS